MKNNITRLKNYFVFKIKKSVGCTINRDEFRKIIRSSINMDDHASLVGHQR